MKKGLLIIGLLILLVAGAIWYVLSGAGGFIKSQIEQQGSKYLDTSVTVFSVDVALRDGRITINDLDVENPQGFSDEDAFSLESITLDIGGVVNEPYVIQTVNVNAPEVLYEVDASGKGNLMVLKDSLASRLPQSEQPKDTEQGANPLLIIEQVEVSNVKLKVDFEQLSTGEFEIQTKSYEVTLPTFTAGPIGKPNGLPADQAGMAVVNAMLDNIIAEAKSVAKKRLEQEAKKLAQDKIDEQKDKLLEKASDKLKGLLDK